MPIYQYKCQLCGIIREVKTTKFESPIEMCCGVQMCQIICPATIVYKCAGFSITDERGLTGHKRKPNIKVRMATPEEKKRLG